MAPVIERTAKPDGTRISLEIPEPFCHFTYRVIMIPIEEEDPLSQSFGQIPENQRKNETLSSQRKSALDFIGYSRKYQPNFRSTEEIMKELREGETDDLGR